MISSLPLLAFGGLTIVLAGCAAAIPSAAPPAVSPADEVTVDFSKPIGTPSYRASGFIYGLSEDGRFPEVDLQRGIQVKFFRAGGAQLGCPNGGYVNGQYEQRWASVKGYYARAKALGATFILLPHDLWGADAVCPVPRWPGDGGDWQEFTAFLGRVIADAKSNGMTGPDVQWDIWNEPDLKTPVQFWGRDQFQYLEMWKRAYHQIRAAIPDAVIVGPSTAGQPAINWMWFTTYIDYIRANQVIPNYLSWHQLVPESDPQTSKAHLDAMLAARGISIQGYQVNEYGSNASEQQAGPSVWYLGRFERAGIDALRANWGMGGGLYLGMGDLVTNAGQPMPSWWAYQRYSNMTGMQVSVNTGAKVDGVATMDAETHRAVVLLGSRAGITGEVLVTFENLSEIFHSDSRIMIEVEQIPQGAAALVAPVVIDKRMVTSKLNLTIPIAWRNAFDAYVITIYEEVDDASPRT